MVTKGTDQGPSPRAIVLNSNDNVATLIDVGIAGATCLFHGERGGQLELAGDIPFGHKICVGDIVKGDGVIKYGQIIGRATRSISMGEHVHVHNVESARGRGDKPER